MGGVASHIEDMKTTAELADGATEVMFGRPVASMSDCDAVAKAFSLRSAHSGLIKDDAFDARIAWEACAASRWIQQGGTRFCPTASVAASFVLTKQTPGELHLPYEAIVVQLPKGFMPSPVVGDYEGTMLITRLPNRMIYVNSFVVRGGGRDGSRVMMFSDDVDESETPTLLSRDTNQAVPGMANINSSTVAGIMPTSDAASVNAASMTIRIVRNLCSWMLAFPPRSMGTKHKHASVTAGEVGASLREGPMVYLKTEVQLDAAMKHAASSLVRHDANFSVRKMAMRHIVRGHWRNQAIKSGHRMMWIAPFWRGPGGPQAWGRIYQLKDNK